MFPAPESVNSIATAIQLALAPVFLLTGIAGMLNVMAGRLSRIIDRGRALLEGGAGFPDTLELELRNLERRRNLASAAITSCTLSALLICTVVTVMFFEVLLDAHLRWLIGILFTTGTIALVVGLAFFLREVHLATQTVRIPLDRAGKIGK